MSLPIASANGIMQTTAAVPAPGARFDAGLAYDDGGNVHVTQTVAATDTVQGAIRRSALGQMVIGPGVAAARPYDRNNGWPTDRRAGRVGVVIAQSGVPSPTDPRLSNGYAVGLLGGLYVSAGI